MPSAVQALVRVWSVQALLVALFAAWPAMAARFLTESVLPEGISAGCKTALLAEVACSPQSGIAGGHLLPTGGATGYLLGRLRGGAGLIP